MSLQKIEQISLHYKVVTATGKVEFQQQLDEYAANGYEVTPGTFNLQSHMRDHYTVIMERRISVVEEVKRPTALNRSVGGKLV